MGFPTKVQLIKRKNSEQWYINFPAAVAQAMEFKKGEVVEWIIEEKSQLVLNRKNPPPSAIKKKRKQASSNTSTGSGNRPGKASSKKG
jgi:bifunctional DNA-binding transcriptional regulator/antitoxin component of YhaV-PrlF toxin-antitoxin module